MLISKLFCGLETVDKNAVELCQEFNIKHSDYELLIVCVYNNGIPTSI